MTGGYETQGTWGAMLREAGAKPEQLTIFPPGLDLDRVFDPSFGSTEGEHFTAWDDQWVYFPVCYDGAEWVERVPRNPCKVATEHVGGG